MNRQDAKAAKSVNSTIEPQGPGRLMNMRCVLGVLALMSFQICGFQMAWGQSAPERSTSLQPDGRYTLFVEVRRPYERSGATLRRMLKDEGYESFAGGEREIVLVLTAEQIGRLFQGRVHYRATGASASDRVLTVPYLEGARIPARFGNLIRRVYFDPQRG